MFQKWLATVIFLPSPDEILAVITTTLPHAAINFPHLSISNDDID